LELYRQAPEDFSSQNPKKILAHFLLRGPLFSPKALSETLSDLRLCRKYEGDTPGWVECVDKFVSTS